ncbi:hypothetical protein M2158_006749 [Streptomyces sp. SAI-144]|nr:hypothetical protein [Streptomyces sp. SAI-144]
MAVLLKPAWRAMKTFAAMLRQARGSVVPTSLVHAVIGLPGHAAYAAAKGALCSLGRQLAVEYGPDIRVNTVLPGPHTAAGTILRCRIDPLSGDLLGSPETFAQLRDDEGSPDGMTVDAEGRLWVALWGAGAVRRYHPDGRLLHTLTVPAPHPTSVCLPPRRQPPLRHHGPPRGEAPDPDLRRGAQLPGTDQGNGGVFLARPGLSPRAPQPESAAVRKSLGSACTHWGTALPSAVAGSPLPPRRRRGPRKSPQAGV